MDGNQSMSSGSLRFLACLLMVSGALLIGYAVVDTRQHADLHDVVTRYMHAVRRGDREQMLSCLAPDVHEMLARDERSTVSTSSQEDFQWGIRSTKRSADAARVVITLKDGEYVVEPEFQLRRLESGWKILGITGLEPDPQWERDVRNRAAYEAVQLERQLRSAFADQPGVDVLTR